MHVLITGGAGFIGSHLVDHLLASNRTVTVIDDLSTGSPDNLAQIVKRDRLKTIWVEVSSDPSRIDREVESADAVFHLAAAVGVRQILDAPILSMQRNLRATEVVVNACARYNRSLFLASTSEVYGKSAAVPFQEDADITYGATSNHRWSYAMAKAIDEFMVLCHATTHALPGVVGRLFNTVGPRQTGRYGMVLPRFVGHALANQPITVYGDGSQTRCFAHVQDVVPAIAELLLCQTSAIGKVVNVGSDVECSILDLAEMVKLQTGSSSDIQFRPYSQIGAGYEDMARRQPDLTRIQKLIGYQPTFSLQEIVSDVIHDMKTRVRSGEYVY